MVGWKEFVGLLGGFGVGLFGLWGFGVGWVSLKGLEDRWRCLVEYFLGGILSV